jgi:hypothetical protein
MARPKIVGVGTKSQFRRAVPKSYSYRYEVASAAGPGDAPQVSAVIETRYRGKSASWNLSRSMTSTESWTLNGTYVAPAPENPLTYPDRPPLVRAVPAAPVAPRAPVAPAPVEAAATPNARRIKPRADPAG